MMLNFSSNPFVLHRLRSTLILDFVSFCNSFCTRSSRSYKLSHSCSSFTLSSRFYFARLPRIWNSLSSIDPLNLPLSSVISHIKSYFWSYFIDHFDPSVLCSFHISCPCSNCISSFSNSPNFTLAVYN